MARPSIARCRPDRLEQEMGQEEPQVERRVAGMRRIRSRAESGPCLMHEDVLGAEVAQDERSLVVGPVHGGDQGVDARREVGMRRAIVR